MRSTFRTAATGHARRFRSSKKPVLMTHSETSAPGERQCAARTTRHRMSARRGSVMGITGVPCSSRRRSPTLSTAVLDISTTPQDDRTAAPWRGTTSILGLRQDAAAEYNALKAGYKARQLPREDRHRGIDPSEAMFDLTDLIRRAIRMADIRGILGATSPCARPDLDRLGCSSS